LEDPDGDIYQRRERRRDPSITFLKGWSAAGKLIVGANVGIGDVSEGQEAVSLDVNFHHPSTYTLQFFTDALQNENPSGVAIRTLAEVIWSVAGNSVRRLISLNYGVALTGSGEGVHVRMFDFSSDALIKSMYTVKCLLSPGPRGQFSQPPFLEIDNDLIRGLPVFTTINAGAFADFVIPPDAGVNSVYFTISAALFTTILQGQILAVQRGPTGQTQKAGNYDIINQWWPVSPGATHIRIFNNTAVQITVTPSWGIEG
jgi:hypothetical protein